MLESFASWICQGSPSTRHERVNQGKVRIGADRGGARDPIRCHHFQVLGDLEAREAHWELSTTPLQAATSVTEGK